MKKDVLLKMEADADSLVKSTKNLEELSKSAAAPSDIVKDNPEVKEEDDEKEEKAEKDEEAAEQKEEEAEKDEEAAEKNEESAEEGEEKGEMKKSFTGNNEIQKAYEASEFLAAMVDETSKVLDGFGSKLNKSLNDTDSVLGAFAKSFSAIATSQKGVMEMVKSIKDGQDAINKRLDEIDSQPQMRKSVSSISVINKDFQKSVGSEQEIMLSKSQVSQALTAMIESGQQGITPGDVLKAESGGTLAPGLMARVKDFYGYK